MTSRKACNKLSFDIVDSMCEWWRFEIADGQGRSSACDMVACYDVCMKGVLYHYDPSLLCGSQIDSWMTLLGYFSSHKIHPSWLRCVCVHGNTCTGSWSCSSTWTWVWIKTRRIVLHAIDVFHDIYNIKKILQAVACQTRILLMSLRPDKWFGSLISYTTSVIQISHLFHNK